jgi:hypothetical protein
MNIKPHHLLAMEKVALNALGSKSQLSRLTALYSKAAELLAESFKTRAQYDSSILAWPGFFTEVTDNGKQTKMIRIVDDSSGIYVQLTGPATEADPGKLLLQVGGLYAAEARVTDSERAIKCWNAPGAAATVTVAAVTVAAA